MNKPSKLDVAQRSCAAAYDALELAEAEVNSANVTYNRVIAELDKEREARE